MQSKGHMLPFCFRVVGFFANGPFFQTEASLGLSWSLWSVPPRGGTPPAAPSTRRGGASASSWEARSGAWPGGGAALLPVAAADSEARGNGCLLAPLFSGNFFALLGERWKRKREIRAWERWGWNNVAIGLSFLCWNQSSGIWGFRVI